MNRNRKSRLLLTTAALAVSSTVGTAPVSAQSYGIHHVEADTLAVTVAADETLVGTKSGIFGQEGAIELDNAGTITGQGTYDGFDAEPDAGVVLAVGPSSIVNSGTITGAGAGISTAYYYDAAIDDIVGRAIGTTVENSGTITGEVNDGIRLIGGGSVANSGTIQGVSGPLTDGISMFAFVGQDTSDQASIGTVANAEGGVISGSRFGIILSGGGVIENAGTIEGNAGAVLIQASPGEPGKTATVTNSGSMAGGLTVGFDISQSDIENSGSITTSADGAAGIEVASGATSIANGGTITTTGQDAHGMLVTTGGSVDIGSSAITTSGLGAYGINATTSSGDIVIESESVEATGNGQTYAISAISDGGGDIVITSGTAVASGTDNSRGIYALVNNGGDITINAGTTVGNTRAIYTFTGTGHTSIVSENATGNGGNAIVGQGATLSITSGIATGTANAAFTAATIFANADTELVVNAETTIAHGYGQYGIQAYSVDTADIISGTVATDGDYGNGITVYAGGAVTIESGSITTEGLLSHGIVVSAGPGEVPSTAPINIVSGTISVSGEESDGIQIASAGDVTIDAGTISATGYGINSLAGGNLEITIGADHSVAGAAGAIQTASSTDLVRNNGAIGGTVDLADGNDTLENAGLLDGDAFLGAGDDALVLLTGSHITGVVDGGDGGDTATLRGTSAVATSAQTVTELANFEQLNVEQGYWITAGLVGAFGEVSIGADGILAVHELVTPAGSDSPIATASIVNNGLLVLDFDNSETLTDFDGLTISGTGGVRLEGEAVFQVEGSDLTYTGTTTVANGGLLLTGTIGGDVATSGDGVFQLGDGGTTGEFSGNLVNNGSFIFNRSDDYDFLGAFSGTGDFTKMGAGTLTFAGDYSYTGITRILGGGVRFAGAIDPTTEIDLGSGTLDISGTPQTIAALSGGGDSGINVTDSTLTVDQASNTSFAGGITGDGGLTKTGDGLLNLTGDSSYTGPTEVNGGTLAVNGSISSTVTVNSGGTLGGNGSVGGATIADNGTAAPGNSIGTLIVNGDIAFAAGSIYEVEVNDAGGADRIDATGTATIAQGSTVQVLAEAGTYRPRTDYTILTADGGVTGTFTTVTSNLAFLTPTLSYSANAVSLALYRNDIEFADVATSFNQASTADAVQALGIGNVLFEDVLIQNDAGARTAFDALSGEIHASVASALTNDSRHVRESLLGAAQAGGEGARIWGNVFGSWGDADARGGVAKVDTDHRGLLAGIGFGGPNVTAGIAAGVGSSDYDAAARASSADVDSTFVGAHVGYRAGAFAATIGGAIAWHDVDTNRSVAFATIAQSPAASYDATTRQVFGELSYDVTLSAFRLAPFARLAHIRTKTDSFAEGTGTASLTVGKGVQKVQFLTLGLHARGDAQAQFQPRLSVGWQHGWGDLSGVASARFAGSAADFTVLGSRLPRDAATIDGGFDLLLGKVRLGASYTGSLANDWSDHGARASLSLSF